MAQYFFDSSALVKFYHAEAGTAFVSEVVRAPENTISLSRLAVTELTSAMAIKARTGALTQKVAQSFLSQFRSDVARRVFNVAGVTEDDFSEADRLLERYAFTLRLRSLDAVQMAVASALRTARAISYFVSADSVLCEVATREGFIVQNPLQRNGLH